MKIPQILGPDREDEAVSRLEHYFTARTSKGRPLFSGSAFDDFAPDRNPRDAFTGEDFLSTGLLGVHVPGKAIVKLFGDTELRHEIESLLSTLPADVDLGDLNESAFERLSGSTCSPGYELWDLIRGHRVPGKPGKDHVGMGVTLTSKLLARKRPRLIPIWDSRIKKQLGLPNSRDHWSEMWHALASGEGELTKRLSRIRARSGQHTISLLRTFDVAVWHFDKPHEWRKTSENTPNHPADDKGLVGDDADDDESASPGGTPQD